MNARNKNTLNEYQNHYELFACPYKKIDEGQNDHRLDRKIDTKGVKHLVFSSIDVVFLDERLT